ncbi:hypothetical protein BJX76DRAFT_353502 [Aspergillus varians]
MKSITLSSVFTTTALLLARSSPVAADETYIGCFSSSDPLSDQGSYQYQSNGYCNDLCLGKNYAVFGLFNADHCFCGNKLPAKSTEVSDSQCSKPCAAWPIVMCGGSSSYSVYLTGLEESVPYYSSSTSTTTKTNSNTNTKTNTNTNNSTSTTSSDDSTTTKTDAATTSSTEDGSEMATATHSSNASADKKEKSNTAAIAAGVVMGVVGLAALIGAIFFLWRFKKRHPADGRMREMSNVEQFGKPVSHDSMSDSRFDGDFMAQKRQSNGSIDDDRDFSRRILQVTNPDRH